MMKNKTKPVPPSTASSRMNSKYIGFIDSGIGGLPYLLRTRERLPREKLLYVADTVNFPYGEKDTQTVRKVVLALVSRLLDRYHCKMVVVACNTASVVALSALRATFPIPFIGVVPAVKPAAENSQRKRIGVLATNRTVYDVYTDKLIKDFASHCTVIRNSGGELVDFIENKLLSSSEEETMRVVKETVSLFKDSRVDTIVLGCTHFVLLDDYFRKAAGDGVRVIDSRTGVTNRIVSLLNANDEYAPKDESGISFFYVTEDRPNEEKYRSIADHFKIRFKGKL